MPKITKFEYQNMPISFEFGDGKAGNKMINATEMAKPFNKPVGNFLRLKETKSYIKLLEDRYSDVNIGRQVLQVIKGGDAINQKMQGTWMDEKLALKFAAWLSPAFELWVYDRIEELLKTGKTELPNHRPDTDLIRAIRMIADKLEYHERDISRNTEAIQEIRDYVGDLEAKILSIDENYYAISGYCAKYGILCPLDKAQAWGIQATSLSHQKRVPIGKAYDAKYGDVNTYHLEILEEVFNNLS